MHHADMVLRRTHIAGILECNPRMPRLEDHREHFLPKIQCLDLLPVDLALLRKLLVIEIELLEFAVFMSWVRRLSSPVFFLSSRNSKMSLCQLSRYAQPEPFRLPPL